MSLATDGSPSVWLYDAQVNPRAGMLVFSDGSPSVGLSDAQGKTRARMSLRTDGASAIGLSDAQGEPRAAMALATNGSPGVALNDAQGFEMDLGGVQTVTPATGATQQTSAASIVMFGNDKERHVIWKAP